MTKDRPYVSRKEGGNIADSVDASIQIFKEYIENAKED